MTKPLDEMFYWDKEDQCLACLLHESFCRHNHTDGCGWFYYKVTDPFWCHTEPQKYLRMAQRILNVIDYETAIKTVQAFKDI